uniref:C3H1-type domain-containing protein n=1 Tax=Ciona savignyi TaxID=51511 RepID=H2YNC6_CIOSA
MIVGGCIVTMPVCSFYLRGRCTMKECPYLHVFVGHAAAVCKSFANDGYCAKADKCHEKHIRVCPEFYATGICKVGGTCKLPHTQQIHRRSKKPSKKLPSQTCSASEPTGFMGFKSIKEGVKIKQQETLELRIQPRLQKFRKPL